MGNWGSCPPGNTAAGRPRDVGISGWKAKEWNGSGSVRLGEDGGQFRVTWNNTNRALPDAVPGRGYSNNGVGYREFDVSMNKSFYFSGDNGYGTKRVNEAGQMRSVGRWVGATPGGKAHAQALVYISEVPRTNPAGDRSSNAIDITVAEWASRSVRSEYESLHRHTFGTGGEPVENLSLSNKTEALGEIQNSGMTYMVFRRTPGDMGEKASYFILRKYNQEYQDGYRLATVDIKNLVSSIDSKDSAFNGLSNWYVSVAGWEVTGANASAGTFEYKCYAMPKLGEASGSTAPSGCWS